MASVGHDELTHPSVDQVSGHVGLKNFGGTCRLIKANVGSDNLICLLFLMVLLIIIQNQWTFWKKKIWPHHQATVS